MKTYHSTCLCSFIPPHAHSSPPTWVSLFVLPTCAYLYLPSCCAHSYPLCLPMLICTTLYTPVHTPPLPLWVFIPLGSFICPNGIVSWICISIHHAILLGGNIHMVEGSNLGAYLFFSAFYGNILELTSLPKIA